MKIADHPTHDLKETTADVFLKEARSILTPSEAQESFSNFIKPVEINNKLSIRLDNKPVVYAQNKLTGSIDGYLLIDASDTAITVTLYMLYVNEPMRRKGIGYSLLEKAIGNLASNLQVGEKVHIHAAFTHEQAGEMKLYKNFRDTLVKEYKDRVIFHVTAPGMPTIKT